MKYFPFPNKIYIITAVLIMFFVLTSYDDDKDFELSKNLDIFHSMLKEINVLYVDETDPGKLVERSMNSILDILDPYTVLIPEDKIEDYRFMLTGEYGGVGMQTRDSEDKIIISNIYEGTPAEKAGLIIGDQIIEVNNKSTEGKTAADLHPLVKGEIGTNVNFRIKRFGVENPLEFIVKREKIVINSISHYAMLKNNIGYLMLRSFTENCAKEVAQTIKELEEKGAKSIIFDLRENPGGLLNEAVDIVNLFVEKQKKIVEIKGKAKKWNQNYETQNEPMFKDMPLAVIINRSSASASEIVSGAMQDLDRAVIIGERSFGKGLVQTTRKLSYNTHLKITTAKYYIPSGRCIQALDYTHRRADGSVGKIADSLISEFKTSKGRKVFDGGGIMPDIKITRDKYSNIEKKLLEKELIFNFATEYVSKNKEIPEPEEFKISDKDYANFKNFVKKHKFEYKTETEVELKELIEKAREEKYYSYIKEDLEKIEEKINHEIDKDLDLFKAELAESIRIEIIRRYYYEKGTIRARISQDEEIKKAIEILSEKDMKEYKAILKL